jgi:hypothetical protein
MPRRALDYYETPPHYVAPLLALIGPLDGLRVYEPCVGRGHISRSLGAAAYVLTNDLDDTLPAAMHFDARRVEAWPTATTLDWTITNPPFSDELAILQHALVSSHNVAFLARLSFLEPTIARGVFWQAHPPTDVIVLPRYSFRLNDAGKRQTDNVTCCWIVYRQGRPPCLSFSVAKESSHVLNPDGVQVAACQS